MSLPLPRRPLPGSEKYALHDKIRRRPVLLFGVPFVVSIVGISFLLSTLTKTRYEYNETKIQNLSKEEELGLDMKKRKVDLREEYFRLMSSKDMDNWDNKRISRLPGQGEWGELPPEKREPEPPPRMV
ncbi:hypothetical protein BT69DRAFT_1347766 [Atractiella rhizophila]|nr:hypothetical protein BT69DRAFT_1353026 [Atractiella rhizophila]KAH8926833.1 hypothetical protein BT69DRAFT_1347766 [Atractiella rhizophila]